MGCTLLSSSSVRVYDSQAYRKVDVTREHISCINTSVIPDWFQSHQCCCHLCYPGEYLRLGTLLSYNCAQVLEAYDCLKLLYIYFNLVNLYLQKGTQLFQVLDTYPLTDTIIFNTFTVSLLVLSTLDMVMSSTL